MSNKKMGRPKVKNPKNHTKSFRLTQETLEKFNECCEILDLNGSEVFEKSINVLYENIKK